MIWLKIKQIIIHLTCIYTASWYVNELGDYWKEKGGKGDVQKPFWRFLHAFNLQNHLRTEKHKTPPLIWDQQLSDMAMLRAKYVTQDPFCKYVKTPDGIHGENFYGLNYVNGSSGFIMDISTIDSRDLKSITYVALDAVIHWYSQIKYYSFEYSGYSPLTAGFTQMLWQKSRFVGLGGARNEKTGCTVIIAYYFPPGNTQFQFKENVHPFQYLYDVKKHRLA